MHGWRVSSMAYRCLTALVIGLPVVLSAPPGPPRKQSLEGDWKITVRLDGGDRTAILSLARDAEERLRGQWISSRGFTELEDIELKDGRLSFTRQGRSRDGQPAAWKFTGTVTEGKLTGAVSRDGAERAIKGRRIRPLPDVVGTWAMGYNRNRISSRLVVDLNKEGKLAAEWQSDGGDVPITDFAYRDGEVTFTFRGSAYEGRLLSHKNTLNGVFTSDGESTPVAAFRIGSAVIGTWVLEVTTDRGPRKQRLKIRRDLSGWYGTVPIELTVEDPFTVERRQGTMYVDFAGKPLAFKAVMERGGRTVELRFSGKVTDSRLTGEMTTPGGSAKVTGTKAPAPARSR